MKTLALILFVGSFLAGAFLTSLDPETVAWSYMVPVLALGLVALWIHRKAEHSEIRSGERLAGNIQVLASSLDNIRRNLEAVVARGDDLPVYEARFEIDRLFREDLDRFAEAQHYADVMSNFAAGERYINRVWSASTDGYVDEVRQYLERARTQFREAQEHFDELAAQFSTQVTDH